MDFSDCRSCQGWGFSDKDGFEACPLCVNGRRIVNEDMIQEAISAKSWLEERVNEVFKDYCEVFKIRRAYGVESYTIRHSTLEIVQDISARNCHDVEDHSLPIEYFNLEHHDRIDLMTKNYDLLVQKKNEEELRLKKAKLALMEQQVEELRRQINSV